MEKSSGTSTQKCGDRPADLRAEIDGLATFLRRVHPRDTAPNVSADTRISARTIENWLTGRSTPRFDHLFVLLEAYGPSVLAASCRRAPRWLDDAVRAERIEKTRKKIEALQASLSEEPA